MFAPIVWSQVGAASRTQAQTQAWVGAQVQVWVAGASIQVRLTNGNECCRNFGRGAWRPALRGKEVGWTTGG